MDPAVPSQGTATIGPARSPPPGSSHIKNRPTGRACSQCNRQKQKCNKELPCSNCIRRNIPHACMYLSRQSRRSRQTAATARPDAQEWTSTASSAPIQHHHHSRTAEIRPITQHLGRLFKARGAPSYHGDSYFGHQSAAVMMEATTPEMSSGPDVGLSHRARITATQPFRSERGPYAQLWELVGCLPRQKAIVDHLTRKFFEELNSTFDSVHEETFKANYAKFWDRKCGYDDLSTVDIRWLSLLFIILAFGELLDCSQPCSVEAQKACEDSSLHFYWAARKSLVIAPSFFGENPDIVRSGILITRYLIHARRISESWLTVSFAVRMAQAQGMHVDGEQLGLPRKVVETRRRLWSQLYVLDRTISLALGRPNSINDRHCSFKESVNIWVDDMTNEEARLALPRPINDPTPTTLGIFHHKLAIILGRIQEDCFSLFCASHDTSYDAVLKHDADLLDWKDKLPPYFALDEPDLSLGQSHPYLAWHRLYLHAGYHFARITLHRSYLLRPSFTDRFEYSRRACISSACADLKINLAFRNPTMPDRLRSNVAAHQLFNSALILGVIALRDPHAPQTEAIIEDLQAYCEKQKADTWVNEFGLAEIRVIELCIARARQTIREAQAGWLGVNSDGSDATVSTREDTHSRPWNANSPSVANDGMWTGHEHMTNLSGLTGFQGQHPPEMWSDLCSGPVYYFPEPTDYQIWEGLVEDLASGK